MEDGKERLKIDSRVESLFTRDSGLMRSKKEILEPEETICDEARVVDVAVKIFLGASLIVLLGGQSKGLAELVGRETSQLPGKITGEV